MRQTEIDRLITQGGPRHGLEDALLAEIVRLRKQEANLRRQIGDLHALVAEQREAGIRLLAQKPTFTSEQTTNGWHSTQQNIVKRSGAWSRRVSELKADDRVIVKTTDSGRFEQKIVWTNIQSICLGQVKS